MRAIVFAGALAVSAVVLTGCRLESLGGPTEESVVSYDVGDKVSALEVYAGSGDIVVTGSDRSGIRVTETMQWRNRKPEARHQVNGEWLRLDYECPHGTCSVSYRVEVPKGTQVKPETGSGDITLRGLTGRIEVTAGSGEVEASGLGAGETTAETGSGNMEFKYGAVPGDVDLRTGSGNISVTVPDASYDITTDTGSGDTRVDVAQDPAAPSKIAVETGSGNIRVLPG
ncbi:DUF4097 family beta strand repeat-containing protein [Nonomuraea longicatena]|uniref:DUF4097 domain-containing protein n=1 Tax=Nonomuraea longicatena TaxID=83682 RepID=A0ABN1PJB7_9ACTN